MPKVTWTKINPKLRSFMYDLQIYMREAGLTKDWEGHDCTYWSDTKSNRKFRMLDEKYVEVSDDNFDRWANSHGFYTKLPRYFEEIPEWINKCRPIAQCQSQ